MPHRRLNTTRMEAEAEGAARAERERHDSRQAKAEAETEARKNSEIAGLLGRTRIEERRGKFSSTKVGAMA